MVMSVRILDGSKTSLRVDAVLFGFHLDGLRVVGSGGLVAHLCVHVLNLSILFASCTLVDDEHNHSAEDDAADNDDPNLRHDFLALVARDLHIFHRLEGHHFLGLERDVLRFFLHDSINTVSVSFDEAELDDIVTLCVTVEANQVVGGINCEIELVSAFIGS